MRSLEEIKRDYEATNVGDEVVADPKFTRVYRMKNQGLRDKLQAEYEETLPEEERLAIYLHKRMCHLNHTDGCYFYYEVTEGFIHDWKGNVHAEYLQKAQAILRLVDYNTAVKLIDSIYQ